MQFSDQLSPSFTVEDLTVTNHSLSSPNIPGDSNTQQNLVYLADVLEQLSYYFDFEILSGYRTKELQQMLTAEGEPTSSGLSFHEVGRAVDIYPQSLDLGQAFGLILSVPGIKERFAEIAYKPSQNSLHLAVNVPGDTRTPKVLGLNTAGIYAALSPEDQQPYIDAHSELVAENDFQEITAPKGISAGLGIGLLVAVALGAGLLFL